MSDVSVDQIREKMIRIRTRANRKATRLGAETRRLMDWRYYVRQFPWGVVAAASVAGFVLVPRKKQTQTAVRMPDGGEVRIVREPAAATASGGIMGMASRMALNLAVRTGMAYGSQILGRILAHQYGEGANSDPASSTYRRQEAERDYATTVR